MKMMSHVTQQIGQVKRQSVGVGYLKVGELIPIINMGVTKV